MSHKGIHFNISERKVLLRLLDILSVITIIYFLGDSFNFDYITVTKENWVRIFILILYISIFGTIFELYDLQKSSKLETTYTNVILTASVTVLFYFLTPFFTPILPDNRLQILYFYLAIILALVIWRYMYVTFIVSPRFYKKVLIVGETSNIKHIIEAFNNSDPYYKIIGFVNCEMNVAKKIRLKDIKEFSPTDMLQIIEKENISEIVISSYNSETITPEIYKDLMTLLKSGFSIKEYTQVYEDMAQRVPVQFVGKDFYKYFPFSRSNKNKMYLFFNRFLNIIISIIGILMSSLLLPLILLGNVFGNRGPLFYTQDRIGKHGNVFRIIKFRTMIENAEKNGAVWSEMNDIRITYFGKFMRHCRLDEIPQFINILKGEMNLIGPRPERPTIVDELSKSIPFYETRHIIKPGITGWAQVKHRYGSSVDDSLMKLQYDLYYIKHRSFFLDLNVIIKTLSTMIFFRGQ